MQQRRFLALYLLILLASAGRADVTVRRTFDFKFGSFLPAAAWETARKQMPFELPVTITTRCKGDKSYTSFGNTVSISDLGKRQTTLLDTRNKRAATVSAATAMASPSMFHLPPEALKTLESLKLDVQSHDTGRTETIRGVETTEQELVISLQLPPPAQGQLRAQVQQWIPKPDEVRRVAWLAELEDHAARSRQSTDSAAAMQKLFAQVPALARAFEPITKSRGVTLKMRGGLYFPGLIDLFQKQGQAVPPGMTADAPLVEFRMDLEEASTEAVPDAIFEVPAGFTASSMEEVMQGMMAGKAPAPAAPPPAAGAFRVGGGVTAPSLLSKREPEYTDEARNARLEGTAFLYVEVRPDGKASNMHVVRSLGLGLDENAIAAVSDWRFRPGEKEGKPVTVAATIEVNFRLLREPSTWPLWGLGRATFQTPAGASRPVLLETKYPLPALTPAKGSVTLSCIVDEAGSPAALRVEKSSDVGLEGDIVAAVRLWRFRPGIKDGKPVAVPATFELVAGPVSTGVIHLPAGPPRSR